MPAWLVVDLHQLPRIAAEAESVLIQQFLVSFRASPTYSVVHASGSLNGEGHLSWCLSRIIPEQAGDAPCTRNNVIRLYRAIDKSKESKRRSEEIPSLGILGRDRARLY
jgi:hypothetical protein